MKDPKLDRKQVAVPVFFVHCLGDSFRVHFESCLVSFLNDGCFHGQCPFETKFGGASLGQNPFDMSNISFIDERGDVAQDLSYVSAFTNILTLEVSDYHPGMQGIMDGTCSCHVRSNWINFSLLCISNSWFFQPSEIYHSQIGDVVGHLSIQGIYFR